MTRHHVTASGLEVVQSHDGFNVIGNNPSMRWQIWRQSGGKWQCGGMTNATLDEVMAHIEQQYAGTRNRAGKSWLGRGIWAVKPT